MTLLLLQLCSCAVFTALTAADVSGFFPVFYPLANTKAADHSEARDGGGGGGGVGGSVTVI